MKKVLFLIIMLVMALAACSSAPTEAPAEEEPAAEAPAEEAPAEEVAETDAENVSPVVGKGVVTGVNKPDDANFDAFTVQNGDRVETAEFAPEDDAAAYPDLGIVAGQKYPWLMITQPDNNNAQAFFVWEVDDPSLQDLLWYQTSEVRGIGASNQPIMRGDTFEIRTQDAENGGLDITFDIYRDNTPVGTFSFVVNE